MTSKLSRIVTLRKIDVPPQLAQRQIVFSGGFQSTVVSAEATVAESLSELFRRWI